MIMNHWKRSCLEVVIVSREPSKHREAVYAMLRQGMTGKQISELTGLSVRMVNRYRLELSDLEPQRQKEHIQMRPGFWTEWTEAVNRIRRHYGMKEFLPPKEGT